MITVRIGPYPSWPPHAVDTGDSDRAELACGDFKLLEQFSVPTSRHKNILVQGNEPAMLRPSDSEIQTVCGAWHFLTTITSWGDPVCRHGKARRLASSVRSFETHATNDKPTSVGVVIGPPAR